MLGLGSAARRGRADIATSSLEEMVRSMHEVERAAVLMLSNAQLWLVGRHYGPGLPDNPAESPQASASVCDDLLAVQKAAEDASANAPEELRRYLRAHATAIGVAHLTMACGLSTRPFRGRSSRVWNVLWSARTRSDNGLVWLKRGEQAAGTPCFPFKASGTPLSDLDVMRFAGRLPTFLRSKPRTPAAASVRSGPAAASVRSGSVSAASEPRSAASGQVAGAKAGAVVQSPRRARAPLAGASRADARPSRVTPE